MLAGIISISLSQFFQFSIVVNFDFSFSFQLYLDLDFVHSYRLRVTCSVNLSRSSKRRGVSEPSEAKAQQTDHGIYLYGARAIIILL